MNKTIYLQTLLLSLGLTIGIQAKDIKGTVRNSDGKPLSGIVVSDGYTTTLTDKRGKYQLDTDKDARHVFISTPAGHISTVRNPEKETCFFHELQDSKKSYDFTVRKNPMDDKDHNIIVIADPQVMDNEDLTLLDKRLCSIIPDISKIKDHYTFGICLGDIVGYDHSLYPTYQKNIDQLGLDFRHVIGNHDMTRNNIRSHEGSMTEYNDFFGPAWYSFNVGEVHYVVLNNNFYIGRDWFYVGYLDETQLRWLEEDLSHVPTDKKVIVCQHMPTTLSKDDRERFSYSSLPEIQANKQPLYNILAPYDAIILSGHMHTCTTQNINDRLVEINIGGLCGAWWCGDICIDGGPAGYKQVKMRGHEAEWQYIGCGYPENYQMKAYVNDRRHQGEVIVNVWDYDDKWTVEYYEDGKKICDMERFTTQDPHALDLFSDPSRYKISWVGAADNANFFKAKISGKAKNGMVKVTDRFGRTYLEEINLQE